MAKIAKIPDFYACFLSITRNDKIISRNDKRKSAFAPYLCPIKIKFMPNAKYQNAGMEYAMWYQEHLLQMESILGKKIEAKIDEIIDMKFNEYIDIIRDERNSKINT